MNGTYDYGLWPMVIVSSAIFIIFALSFTRPKSWRDWRSFGAFSAFVVALFTEMYGFPLTIYLLSGWLGSRYPGMELFSHENGHLWETIFGGGSKDPTAAHFNVSHLISNGLIAGGFILIASAWRVLHKAQQRHELATTGAYAYVRHPQYIGFIAVLLGFLVQWPTILTLAMFPVLVWMYTRLARIEEKEVRESFGEAYDAYAELIPRFVPRWGVRYEPSPEGPSVKESLVPGAESTDRSEVTYG